MSDIGMILDRLGRTLLLEVAPKLQADYAAGHVALGAGLLAMAGEAWDGAADRLMSEIAGLRRLLQDGGVDVSPIDPAPSLKISDLTGERDALAKALITLQTDLENRPGAEARALTQKIWHHLLITAQARMPSPPQLQADA